MGGFRVEHPIRIEELKAFLRAFSQSNAALDDENLPGLVNIKVGRYKLIREALAQQTDQEINKSRKVDREKYTMTVYARAVAWMRKFIEAIRTRDKLPSVTSGSRILRDLIDLAVDQKHTFMGMSATRNSEEYLVYHSVNTCLLSILLGNQLGFTKEQLHDLGRSALMHDIGAAFADPSLMDKQGQLSAEERARIKQNPLIAARVLMRVRPLDLAALKSIVAAHESKMPFFFKHPDGQGGFRYQPTRSLGLYGRIIKVASTFDALTSARPYREAFAPEIAVQVMLNQMRHDFDPAVLDLLILMLQGSSVEYHGGDSVQMF